MEFEIDQAKDIISNPDNPNHAKYMQGDQEMAGAVQRAYSKAFPSKVNLLADAGRAQPAAAQASDDSGEDAERADAEKALIEHWGGEAQAKVQVVSDWARSTIGEAGLEALHQKYPGLMNDAGVIKALHAALSR